MLDIFGFGLAFGSFFFISVVPFALLALAIPYAVLRLRTKDPADPQLGIKIGLQYFFSVAIIVGLTGLTIMAVDLVTREDVPVPQLQRYGRPTVDQPENEWFNAAQRTGVGMILSSLLLALLHFWLARTLTNKVHWPRVRRTFAGWRFAIHGSVVMFAVTILAILVLQKDAFEPPIFRSIKAVFAVLAVWIPAWVIHLILLKEFGRPPRAGTSPIGTGATET